MENDVTTAESFLYLDQSKLKARTQFVQSDCNLRIFLLVLIILRQSDLATGKVIYLRLGAVGTHAICSGRASLVRLLAGIAHHKVLNALVLG